MIPRRLTIVLGLLLVAMPATAQQALTLAEAQAEARAHAPEAAELDALVHGAEAIAAQASRRIRQNPEISGTYFNGALTGRSEETSWSLGAKWPVDVSGSWNSRGASAGADVARTRFERDDGLRALDEHVAVALADVALQQRLVARSERIVDLQTIAANAAHRQLDVGQGTQLEADSADLDLASARVALERTRGALTAARAQLARLLGRDTYAGFVVDDPPEPLTPLQRPEFAALVDRDPRVQAALSEIDGAKFERATFERLVTPMPTFGFDAGYTRRDIPSGAFTGSLFANTLTAVWPDRELVFNVSLPIPLFDRQQEPRARATGRLLTAEAKLRTTRATVRSELEETWATVDAAQRAADAVANMPAVIDRDTNFVEQAVRAGAFDALTRTQALRRLADTGRAVDTAIREYRAARAAWIRRSLQ
jgi:cobalt-zinc-cadmium efflux system outer membrane protein